MPTTIEIESAYSHASALGDNAATAHDVVVEICALARELQGGENAIQDLTSAAHAELGTEFMAKLKALRLEIGDAAEKARAAKRVALAKADKIEREYLAALDAAQKLEASAAS